MRQRSTRTHIRRENAGARIALNNHQKCIIIYSCDAAVGCNLTIPFQVPAWSSDHLYARSLTPNNTPRTFGRTPTACSTGDPFCDSGIDTFLCSFLLEIWVSVFVLICLYSNLDTGAIILWGYVLMFGSLDLIQHQQPLDRKCHCQLSW